MIFRTWRVLGVKVIVRTTPSPQCLQPNLTLLQVCVQEKSFPWKIDQNIRLFEKRKTDLKTRRLLLYSFKNSQHRQGKYSTRYCEPEYLPSNLSAHDLKTWRTELISQQIRLSQRHERYSLQTPSKPIK